MWKLFVEILPHEPDPNSDLEHPVNVWKPCQYVEQFGRLDWGRLKEIR